MIGKCLIYSFYFFMSYGLSGQVDYEKVLNNSPQVWQEKVYLHFDKFQYAAGDDLWFKAYVTDATTHLPTEISNNLYVELIDGTKAIVDSLTLFVEAGTAHGNFSLSRKIEPGNYTVRAYTNWMRNYSNDFFFRKEIVIINPSLDGMTGESERKLINEKRNIRFLPEGGDLIEGISTKVAFKVTNWNSKGTLANGIIIDNTGAEITSFKSNKLGYGQFFLNKPKAGEDYRAVIDSDTFQLPDVKIEGATIRLKHSFKSEDVLITVESNNVDLNNGTLVIHRRGEFLSSTTCTNKSYLAVKIKKSQLKTGIIHITFFDKNVIPLSERLVFPLPPMLGANIEMETNKDVYEKRTKVTLNLDSNEDTVYSASVTINPHEESSYSTQKTNIVNYLLMTSDLKGRIESPNTYFEGSEEAYRNLDILMLTHGWVRFNWQELLKSREEVTKHLPEKGLTINGEIRNYNNKILADQPVGITIFSLGLVDHAMRTDRDGTFQIGGLRMMDSTMVIIQARREKKNKIKKNLGAKVYLLHPPRPDVLHPPRAHRPVHPLFIEKARKLDQISKAYFLDDNVTELDEVVVSAERRELEELKKRTFYDNPSNRLMIDSLGIASSGLSPFEALRQVPGVRIVGSFPSQTALVRGLGGRIQEASYFLDGAPVGSEEIQNLPLDQIKFIDVLKGTKAAIIGTVDPRGAILVYTKRADDFFQDEKSNNGLLTFLHPGYHQSKEFFSPQYDVFKEEHVIPDFRTTLHWNPNLQFENNKAQMVFYTSDQSGPLTVRVEGIYTNGEPFFEVQTIEVK